jgi:hypothetical protein
MDSGSLQVMVMVLSEGSAALTPYGGNGGCGRTGRHPVVSA